MNRQLTTLPSIIMLIFILSSSLNGQQNVPFLCENGLYGLSDSSGNMIADCRYDEIVYHRTLKMYIAQKENKCGLLSIEGKAITPFVFSKNYYIKQLEFRTSDPNKVISLLIFKGGSHFTLFDTLISNINVAVAENIKYETKHFHDYNFHQPYLFKGFINGYYKFKRQDGGVNFFKYNGAPLFDQDIVNGKALDSTMFAVEGENGKLALKNSDGELITPYLFNAIEKFDSNYYRVNSSLFYDDDFDTTQSVAVGLIDTKGHLIVDTAYAWIKPFANDKFIVYTHKTKVGVLGNEHQVIIPFEYDNITPFVDQKVIMKKGDTSLIYDLSTQNVLLKTNEHISYDYTQNLLYLRPPYNSNYRSKKEMRILTEDLKEIYVGNYETRTYVKPTDHILLRLKGNKYVYLSREGEQQLISAYTFINLLIFENNRMAFRVNLGDSVGLLNPELKEVIPPIFEDIQTKEVAKDSIVVIAKIQGQELYRVFDLQGRELSPSPVVDQAFFFNQRIKAIVKKEGENKKIIRRDGSSSIMPNYTILDREYTLKGNRLYKVGYKGQDKAYVLNGAFYNIIPKGFHIPKQPYESSWLEYGLIPVISKINSGVIDEEGNWVIEPSYHGYAIISPDVIGQYDGRPSRGLKHVELFKKRNGHWDQEEFYHVNPIVEDSFIIVAQEKVGFERNAAYGLLDLKGNSVIDCNFTHTKINDNFITAYYSTSDSSGETSVFDRNGTFILKIPFKVLGFYSNSHMRIQNQNTLKEGAMNFDKDIVIPVKYRNLKYYPNYNLASYLNEDTDDKSYTLVTSDGKVLYQKGYRDPIFFEYQGQKRIVFIHNEQVTLVDEKLNSITTLPYSFVSSSRYSVADQKIDGYFTVKNHNNQKIYINILTGQLMAD